MTVHGLLAELRVRDIRVWAEGDRLKCSAPPDALTAALRDELGRRKRDIIEFLHSAQSLTRHHRAIVPLHPAPVAHARPPIFGIGGHNGDVFCYLSVAGHLPSDQPLYGLQPPGLDGVGDPVSRIEELAAYFEAQIRAFYPAGPCVIAGFCAGGTAAFELGRCLLSERSGVSVALLAAPLPCTYTRRAIARDALRRRTARLRDWTIRHATTLAGLPGRERARYLFGRLAFRSDAPSAPDPVFVLRSKVERATIRAVRRYSPGRFDGRLCIYLPAAEDLQSPLRFQDWRWLSDSSEVYVGPDGCTRDEMLHEPHAAHFARLLAACAATATACPTSEVSETDALARIGCADPRRKSGPRPVQADY